MSNRPVAVIGSMTVDVTARAATLPRRGETVHGDLFTMTPGGKGANQALMSSRFGADTSMVGCVGDDLFEPLVRRRFAENGVDTRYVRTIPECATGIAHIRVDGTGDNDIVIVPNANTQLCRDDVDAFFRMRGLNLGVLLLQLETPVETAAYAAEVAHRHGWFTILDPAPAQELPQEMWSHIDVVTPNETEASILTSIDVVDIRSATAAARWFLDRGTGRSIVTLGAAGAVVVDHDGVLVLDAPAVGVVDTTGAGDAFAGTLAAGIAEGLTDQEVLRYAMAAGALTVTRPGASGALPERAAVQSLAGPAGRVSAHGSNDAVRD